MQIKRTDQPVPTTKVEDDKRVEVSKLKPGGQQIPDSFEQGKSRTSDSDNGASKPAEPVKKAGQRTGAQLALKMTEARLGEAGIKSPGSAELKDLAGRKEPGKDEQDAADPIKTKLKRDNPRETGTSADGSIPHLISTQDKFPEASKDARSNHDGLHNQEMQNFLKEHGFETPASGSGADPTGRPGALDPGGPTGPPDPMSNANAQMSKVLDRSKQSFDRLVSQVASGINSPDEPTANYGKDMIAEPSLGIDPTPQEIAAAKKKHAQEHPDNPPEKAPPAEKDPNKGIVQSIKDVAISFLLGIGTPKGVVLPPAPPDPETGKNMMDGFKAIFENKDKTPESETKKGGTVHDSTQEGYQKQQGEKLHKLMKDKLGSDTLDIPKQPRIQGDKDPSPEATTLADAAPNIYGRVGEGMVSQPNSQNESGQSSGHLSSDSQVAGGAGEVWHGVTHTENEADALSNQELKPKAEDDEEKKKSTTSFGDIAKRNKNLISKLKDN